MIVLDTNVISELARPTPDARVRAWFKHTSRSDLYTTAISEAELRYGVAVAPAGRRRDELIDYVNQAFTKFFAGCVLSFDSAAAGHYADIAATRRRAGKPISYPDAQIAAITRSHGAALATRNIKDFADCGVALIDPWAG